MAFRAAAFQEHLTDALPPTIRTHVLKSPLEIDLVRADGLSTLRQASKAGELSAFLSTAAPLGGFMDANNVQPVLPQQQQPPIDESRGNYGGELQIVEDFRSPGMTFSDLTDSWNFTCWKTGPVKREPTPLEPVEESGEGDQGASQAENPMSAAGWPFGQMGGRHPQLEFSSAHHKVHVHLEDKSAEYPSGRVLWDADYDMGGTEVLKGYAKAIGGEQQEFHPLCPPLKGPAHWYELTVTRRPPKGTAVRLNPHHGIEDFIGSQVVSTFRPDQDPEQSLFGAAARAGGGGGTCTLM